MVRRAVQRSFNAITVDGDTSTNDTVLAFAAGPPLAEEHHAVLEQGLTQAMQLLAQAIARDGEGATCLIEVQVAGAADEAAALQVAHGVWVVLGQDRCPWSGSELGADRGCCRSLWRVFRS